jgi:acetoin utilization deacetylase AcuC-like enzyme
MSQPDDPPLVVVSTLDGDVHDAGADHPERIDRLAAAQSGLKELDADGAVAWLRPRTATPEELTAVHASDYLARLEEICHQGGGAIDPDTVVSRGSWETACRTAGAGLVAAGALGAGQGRAAMVLGRPPGHHAGRSTAMGFCLINNVAVTAAALASGGERVAIVDWDVHHGNGTQDIFWSHPSVLYASIHQWPLYPGTGRAEDRGGGPGYGTTINMPLPPGTTGDTYRALFDEVLSPCIEHFRPTWILVSAGFDAHRADPLGDMSLTAGDFADLTGRILQMVPAGRRTILFLEGGYDLGAVEASVAATAARLVGDPGRGEPPSSGADPSSRVDRYRRLFVEESDG